MQRAEAARGQRCVFPASLASAYKAGFLTTSEQKRVIYGLITNEVSNVETLAVQYTSWAEAPVFCLPKSPIRLPQKGGLGDCRDIYCSSTDNYVDVANLRAVVPICSAAVLYL